VRLRLRRKQRNVLVGCGVVAAFVVALIAFAGHAPTSDSPAAGAPKTSTGPTGALGSASPGASASATPAKTAASSRTPDVGKLLPPSLPGFALTADPGGLPFRSVKIVITSDAVVAGFGYLVANGKPPRYSTYFVKSPVTVVTVARSNGVAAFAVAQAAATGTYVSCKLFVDGTLKASHTARGPYKTVACLG
jgi:hypothetical protein